jgi:hypothetical protein
VSGRRPPPAGERAWQEIGELPDFWEGASVFSDNDDDRAFFVNGTQVVHVERDGRLAVRVTKPVVRAHRAVWRAEGRVEERRRGSDWVVVSVDDDAGAATAVDLARLAAEAHQPPPGVAPKPPPMGADLARRRRFH